MNDYTLNDITDALNEIGISEGDTLYCHSNIANFGILKDYYSKENVCKIFYNAIFNVIGDKGTLIIPTYTTHVLNNNIIYDPLTTVSNMGVFAEWIRLNTNSIRTIDPVYSNVCIGAQALYYSNNTPNNSFSSDSVFGKLHINNAKILCLNHAGCTFLHYVERQLSVPYRFDKTFNCRIYQKNYITKYKWTIWVRYLSDKKLLHSPKKYLHYIKDKSIASYTQLGRGELLAISASDVYDVVNNELKHDQWFLINAKKNDNSVYINQRYK